MNRCSRICIACSSQEDLVFVNYSKFHKMCIICATSQIENKLMQCRICNTKIKIVYRFIQAIIQSLQYKEMSQYNRRSSQRSENPSQVIPSYNQNPSLSNQLHYSINTTSNEPKNFPVSANQSYPYESNYRQHRNSLNYTEDYSKAYENSKRSSEAYSKPYEKLIESTGNYFKPNENNTFEDYSKTSQNIAKSWMDPQNVNRRTEVQTNIYPNVMKNKPLGEEAKSATRDKAASDSPFRKSEVNEEQKRIYGNQSSRNPKKCQSCSITYDYQLQIGNCGHFKCKACAKEGLCGACDPNITCKTCKITCFLSSFCVHKFCEQCRKRGDCKDCKCYVCKDKIYDLNTKKCGHYLCPKHFKTNQDTCETCKSNIFICSTHKDQTFFVQDTDRSRGYIHFSCCRANYCIICRFPTPGKNCVHNKMRSSSNFNQRSPIKKK